MDLDWKVFIQQTVNIIADILSLCIFLRVLLSWFTRESSALSNFLVQVTEPLLAPIRRALPQWGVLDFSPLVALFLISILRALFNSALL